MTKYFLIILICTAFLSLKASAQLFDWRGPNRTGIYNETNLLKDWGENGPDLLWEANGLGMGYSSVTISNDAIYVTGRKDTTDVLTCLTLDGAKQWETVYGRSWFRSYSDSRCTPTYYNGKIYVVSGMGDLVCLDERGKVLWSQNHYTAYDSPYARFGISESPLIVDDKVIVSPGGNKASLVAYDLSTGAVRWEAEPLNEESHYVNPLLIHHGGKKLIVSISSNHIIGIDAKDGKLLWKEHYTSMNNPTGGRMRKNHANTPTFRDGKIFICSGYNHTSVMLQLSSDAGSVEILWKNKDIDPHHGGVVLLGDYLFSSNYENNANGDWICVDWNSGETQWIKEWHNKGSIISADGLLYLYEEKSGNVGLVRPNPKKMEVISEFKIEKGNGPHWSHPVIRNGKLYIRHGEILMVYDIKQKA